MKGEKGPLFLVFPKWHRLFLKHGGTYRFNEKIAVFKNKQTLNGLPNE